MRTLRELGVSLADIKRVLTAQASLGDVAAAHARALDVQIRTLRLQRAVLTAVARSTDAEELERMTDLTTLTVEERRRILEDYLTAVFGGEPNPVADRFRQGAPELPDEPTPDQIAAWVELAALLRDPDFVQASRRMAERGRAEGAEPDGAHAEVAAVGERAGAAVRARVDPTSPAGLAVLEAIEAMTANGVQDRRRVAERIEAFTDRRVFRYWTLVAVVNGWSEHPVPQDAAAWEWYAAALRAHAIHR